MFGGHGRSGKEARKRKRKRKRKRRKGILVKHEANSHLHAAVVNG